MNENFTIKVVLGVAAATLLILGTLHFAFGVSSTVTLTIVLSFLIVLITAGGCALHLRELDKLEEVEALERMQERVDTHLTFINEILAPAKRRLKSCETQLSNLPGNPLANSKNLIAAKQIIESLEARLDQLLTLLESGRPENILKANDISESNLKPRYEHSSLELASSANQELESHLWRETLDLLFIQTERLADEKVEASA